MSIDIPESYIGKNIEILAFVLDDLENKEKEDFINSKSTGLASEQILAVDWLSKEEDEVWKNL